MRPPNRDRSRDVRGPPTTTDSPAAPGIPESGARFANERRSRRPHLGCPRRRRRRSRRNRWCTGRAGAPRPARSAGWAELPLVDIAIAMSPAFARAISWRANTSSNPTSLPSAVRIAWSAVSDQAGSGLPSGGRANSRASVVESVQLPPFPKVNNRPPAANRRAISAAARSSRSALASSVVRRSARLSAAFACADAARSASSDSGSSSSASMNGYRKLVGSSGAHQTPSSDAADRRAGVHQHQLAGGDRVDRARSTTFSTPARCAPRPARRPTRSPPRPGGPRRCTSRRRSSSRAHSGLSNPECSKHTWVSSHSR